MAKKDLIEQINAFGIEGIHIDTPTEITNAQLTLLAKYETHKDQDTAKAVYQGILDSIKATTLEIEVGANAKTIGELSAQLDATSSLVDVVTTKVKGQLYEVTGGTMLAGKRYTPKQIADNVEAQNVKGKTVKLRDHLVELKSPLLKPLTT